MLETRRPLYAKITSFVFENSGGNLNTLVNEIIEKTLKFLYE
jgi:shikimate kinase